MIFCPMVFCPEIDKRNIMIFFLLESKMFFCFLYFYRFCNDVTMNIIQLHFTMFTIQISISKSRYLPCIAWKSIKSFIKPILVTIYLANRFKNGIFCDRRTLICGYKLRIANISLIRRNHFLYSKMSSRRVCKTSSLRCFQDVFNTNSRRRLASTSGRCLEDVLMTSRKIKTCYAEDVFKTTSRRLKTRLHKDECLLSYFKLRE